MKRLLILCFICSSCLVQAQQLAYNKQDILNIVYQITLEKNIDVLVSKQPLPPNTAITTLYKPFVSPEYDSWFVFLDEHPYESWWHDCKYIFIEIKTGEYEVFKMSYPPDIDNMEIIKKYIFDDAEELTAYKIPEYETPKNAVTSDNEWAVIINGGISDYFNHQRYWNHISFIYSTLIHEYGYQKSHVFVLCSDGTNPGIDRHLINGGFDSSPLDLDGDGLADIQYSATKSNIGTVFDILSDSLDVNDNLFIYTTDHGGQINGQDVFLYLWGDTIGDDLFATEVNKVNAGKINTCMVQCHSGGFIDNLQATNRVIATACRYDESAYAMNDLQYSEFTYYWISAVAGKTPTGTTTYADTDGDGFVSMSEAFNYAEFNDTQSETPQYNSTPISLGNNLSLIGMITRIIGPSILCSSGGSYSISNVPSGASITWSSSTGIARTSAQGSNPCNFIATNSGTTGWVSATITYNGNNISLPQKTMWLGGVPSPELYANNATLTGSDWYTVVLNTPDVYFCLVPDPTGSPIYPDTWEVEGDSYWYTNGSFLEFVPNVLGENIVAGYRHNTCGFNGTYFTIEVVSSKSGEVVEDIYFKLSPNPANEYVDIKLALPDEEKMVDSYRVDFVDSYSRNVKQVVLSGLENRVNIQDLHPGYYVVLLRYNGEVYSNKLILE